MKQIINLEKWKNNWGWKLVSLLFAFLLWSYVVAAVNPTQKLDLSGIELSVLNKDQLRNRDLELMDLSDQKLTVSLSGKRTSLGAIRKSDIQAVIDVKDLSEGAHILPVRYQLPANVVLNRENSQMSVQVKLEKIIHQSLPVTVETTGDLPDSYILERIAASPVRVPCTGARSHIDQVKSLQAVIDISALNQDTSANVKIRPVNEKGEEVRGLDLSLSEVNVDLDISKKRTLPLELVLEGEPSENRLITETKLNPAEVLIKGDQSRVDGLEKIMTKPVDRAKITASGLYPLELALPEGIRLVDAGQAFTAEFSVEAREEKHFSFSLDKAHLLGLDDRFQVDLLDRSLTITLSGYPSQLKKIGPENCNVRVHFDAYDNLQAGSYPDVPVEVVPPEGVEVLKLLPERIRAELRNK